MIAKVFTASVAASALMATIAFAQTPTTPTATTDKADMPTSSGYSVQGDWRASKVVGLKVVNDTNEAVGSIDDLLTDSQGNIKAVVIGVGGVLGVGEHLVAVPYDKVKFVTEPVASTSASTTPEGATGKPMASTTTGAATTNTVPTGAAPAMKANPNPWVPDHAVFNATKDELKAMPEFKYSS